MSPEPDPSTTIPDLLQWWIRLHWTYTRPKIWKLFHWNCQTSTQRQINVNDCTDELMLHVRVPEWRDRPDVWRQCRYRLCSRCRCRRSDRARRGSCRHPTIDTDWRHSAVKRPWHSASTCKRHHIPCSLLNQSHSNCIYKHSQVLVIVKPTCFSKMF